MESVYKLSQHRALEKHRYYDNVDVSERNKNHHDASSKWLVLELSKISGQFSNAVASTENSTCLIVLRITYDTHHYQLVINVCVRM